MLFTQLAHIIKYKNANHHIGAIDNASIDHLLQGRPLTDDTFRSIMKQHLNVDVIDLDTPDPLDYENVPKELQNAFQTYFFKQHRQNRTDLTPTLFQERIQLFKDSQSTWQPVEVDQVVHVLRQRGLFDVLVPRTMVVSLHPGHSLYDLWKRYRTPGLDLETEIRATIIHTVFEEYSKRMRDLG